MLRIILLFITVITIAHAEYVFNLKFFIPGEKPHNGSLTHKENKSGTFNRELKMFDNENLIDESIENFDQNSNILSVKKTDFRCNKQQIIKFYNDHAHLDINGNNFDLDIQKEVTFGTGFFDKSKLSIERALNGYENNILVLVPEKQDWFTLTTTKTEYISYNGGKAIMMTIVPKSLIIRMFAKEIIFIFDTSEKHKPLEFIGVLPFYNSKCEPTNGKIYFEEQKL